MRLNGAGQKNDVLNIHDHWLYITSIAAAMNYLVVHFPPGS